MKRLILVTLSLISFQLPASHPSGVIITPQTPSPVLASYTQAINTAGLLDKTFGGTGFRTFNLSGYADRAQGVAIQADGKLLVVGETNANFTLVQSGVFLTLRYNTNGTLDTSFGNGAGYVTTSFSGAGGVDGAFGVAVQSDGKIVVVGQTNINHGGAGTGYFGIVRYNSDGSPDTSFGPYGNGTTTLNITGAGFSDGATCVAIQSDGKIVVAGGTNISETGGVNGDIALIRYNTNGLPDNAFGPNGNGIITLHLSAVDKVDSAYAVTVQPDGKIVVVGGANIGDNTVPGNIVLLRYTTTGAYDATFGSNNGIVQTNISGAVDTGYGVALQSDGKIVVTGVANLYATSLGGAGTGYIATLRYSPQGILDTTFGPNHTGYVTINLSGANQLDLGTAVTVQQDGKILAVGATNYLNGLVVDAVGNIVALRYNTDGSYDTSFGPLTSPGIVQYNISGLTDYGTATVLQPDGKIIIVGLTNLYSGDGTPGTGDFFILRYTNPFTLSSFNASYGPAGAI